MRPQSIYHKQNKLFNIISLMKDNKIMFKNSDLSSSLRECFNKHDPTIEYSENTGSWILKFSKNPINLGELSIPNTYGDTTNKKNFIADEIHISIPDSYIASGNITDFKKTANANILVTPFHITVNFFLENDRKKTKKLTYHLYYELTKDYKNNVYLNRYTTNAKLYEKENSNYVFSENITGKKISSITNKIASKAEATPEFKMLQEFTEIFNAFLEENLKLLKELDKEISAESDIFAENDCSLEEIMDKAKTISENKKATCLNNLNSLYTNDNKILLDINSVKKKTTIKTLRERIISAQKIYDECSEIETTIKRFKENIKEFKRIFNIKSLKDIENINEKDTENLEKIEIFYKNKLHNDLHEINNFDHPLINIPKHKFQQENILLSELVKKTNRSKERAKAKPKSKDENETKELFTDIKPNKNTIQKTKETQKKKGKKKPKGESHKPIEPETKETQPLKSKRESIFVNAPALDTPYKKLREELKGQIRDKYNLNDEMEFPPYIHIYFEGRIDEMHENNELIENHFTNAKTFFTPGAVLDINILLQKMDTLNVESLNPLESILLMIYTTVAFIHNNEEETDEPAAKLRLNINNPTNRSSNNIQYENAITIVSPHMSLTIYDIKDNNLYNFLQKVHGNQDAFNNGDSLTKWTKDNIEKYYKLMNDLSIYCKSKGIPATKLDDNDGDDARNNKFAKILPSIAFALSWIMIKQNHKVDREIYDDISNIIQYFLSPLLEQICNKSDITNISGMKTRAKNFANKMNKAKRKPEGVKKTHGNKALTPTFQTTKNKNKGIKAKNKNKKHKGNKGRGGKGR